MKSKRNSFSIFILLLLSLLRKLRNNLLWNGRLCMHSCHFYSQKLIIGLTGAIYVICYWPVIFQGFLIFTIPFGNNKLFCIHYRILEVITASAFLNLQTVTQKEAVFLFKKIGACFHIKYLFLFIRIGVSLMLHYCGRYNFFSLKD